MAMLATPGRPISGDSGRASGRWPLPGHFGSCTAACLFEIASHDLSFAEDIFSGF